MTSMRQIVRGCVGILLAALAAPMCGTAVADAGGLSLEGGGAIAPPTPALPARPPLPPRAIPTIPLSKLPPEAQRTFDLIRRGGPFPYAKDGTVFGNRERRLPLAPMGYYREYTVPTPGSRDRGARRLVTGKQREVYYTPDHYRSFMQVAE
jgi:ribonuclease T1